MNQALTTTQTRSNRTFSSWAVVQSPNPTFDLSTEFHSALDCTDLDDDKQFESQSPEQFEGQSFTSEAASTPTLHAPLSRKQKLKAALQAREKKKRGDATKITGLVSNAICKRFPQDRPSVCIKVLKGVVMEDSPVAGTGFTGKNDVQGTKRLYTLAEATGPGSKLGYALQKWNGRDPMLIVDKNGIVCAILAGHPNMSDWHSIHDAAVQALETRRDCCCVPLEHCQGTFITLRCGVSHGGGQMHPMNLRNDPVNKKVVDELNQLPCFKQIANFGSAALRRHAPCLYAYYSKTLAELQGCDSSLRHPFPGSIYSSAAYNFGPRTVCYKHKDKGNLPFGYCAITPMGTFDPELGGHLILSECDLVIEFPPGSTILIPSAVVAHSNCAIQPQEKCYSFTQYSAGSLFRWVNNNGR